MVFAVSEAWQRPGGVAQAEACGSGMIV